MAVHPAQIATIEVITQIMSTNAICYMLALLPNPEPVTPVNAQAKYSSSLGENVVNEMYIYTSIKITELHPSRQVYLHRLLHLLLWRPVFGRKRSRTVRSHLLLR